MSDGARALLDALPQPILVVGRDERVSALNAPAAVLLGVSGRTWSRAKTGEEVRLAADNLDRISAMVGVYKGLHLYFSDALSDRWVRLENEGPPFQGRTPLTYMTGGLPNLLATRAYVDALRGGL